MIVLLTRASRPIPDWPPKYRLIPPLNLILLKLLALTRFNDTPPVLTCDVTRGLRVGSALTLRPNHINFLEGPNGDDSRRSSILSQQESSTRRRSFRARLANSIREIDSHLPPAQSRCIPLPYLLYTAGSITITTDYNTMSPNH